MNLRRLGPGIGLFMVLAACAAPSAPSSTEAAVAIAPASESPSPPARAARMPGRPELIAWTAGVRPPQPALAADYRVELVPDPCVDRDLPAPPSPDVALTVLDRSYTLPASHVPADLVAAAAAGLTGSSATKPVSASIVDDLAAMRAAWERAGLTIIIDSAYRSYAAQATTFEAWAAQLGPAEASLRAARPGHSEHQLGTALDVSSPGWSGRFGDWARESAEGAWMAAHAWEYGFVMSFPAGAEEETCFGYEPWHYRWIGRDLAAEHRADGGALRTFLAERAGG